MEEFVSLLSKDLEYLRHEMTTGLLYIYVKSRRKEADCPCCGLLSGRVHSKYTRRFRDLPMQGKKVEIVLENRNYFCENLGCERGTFAETFDFLPYKAKRSLRLTESIMELALNVSSVTASELLRKETADVGKSTICNLLKKGPHHR